MKTLLLKALGIKGIWIYLAQIILEMLSAQDEILPADGGPSLGKFKLQRVLERLKRALSNVLGIETYWPAIKAAATRAIAANKELYTVLTDAISAAKAAK